MPLFTHSQSDSYMNNDNLVKTELKGCIIDDRERNEYHDSDFYFIAWDNKKKAVIQFDYATTRYPSFCRVEKDITKKNWAKTNDWCFDNMIGGCLGAVVNFSESIFPGKKAEVIGGRKVPKGTIVNVFWTKSQKNPWDWGNSMQHIAGVGWGKQIDKTLRNGKVVKNWEHTAFVQQHQLKVIKPEQYLHRNWKSKVKAWLRAVGPYNTYRAQMVGWTNAAYRLTIPSHPIMGSLFFDKEKKMIFVGGK